MGTRSAEGEVKLIISGTIKNTMTDGQQASCPIGDSIHSGKLTDGVSADQFNRAWEEKDRALASGVTETIDLYDLGSLDIGGGAGKDALGQALTFEEIVTLVITQTGGDGRLEINTTSPANALAWMPSMTVANGGALRVGASVTFHNPNTDAWPVTDGASHQVNFKASGGDVTYSIYMIGRHDDDESSSSSQSTKSSSSSASSSSSSTLSSLSSSSTGVSSQSASSLSSQSSSSSSTSTVTMSASSSSSSTGISSQSASSLSSSSTSSLSSSSSSSLNV